MELSSFCVDYLLSSITLKIFTVLVFVSKTIGILSEAGIALREHLILTPPVFLVGSVLLVNFSFLWVFF